MDEPQKKNLVEISEMVALGLQRAAEATKDDPGQAVMVASLEVQWDMMVDTIVKTAINLTSFRHMNDDQIRQTLIVAAKAYLERKTESRSLTKFSAEDFTNVTH